MAFLAGPSAEGRSKKDIFPSAVLPQEQDEASLRTTRHSKHSVIYNNYLC